MSDGQIYVCPSVEAMKHLFIPSSCMKTAFYGHKYVQIPLRNHGFQGVFHMDVDSVCERAMNHLDLLIIVFLSQWKS